MIESVTLLGEWLVWTLKAGPNDENLDKTRAFPTHPDQIDPPSVT